jgi:pyridoxal phosphate enzyme (YggS family)
MPNSRRSITDNLARIRENIAAAAAKTKREPSSVRLVAVTKTADLEQLKALVELGAADLAESRVQQLGERADELDSWLNRRRKEPPPPVRWHMVGHLQRNKVKDIVGRVCLIHSVDSLRLAEEIESRSAQQELVSDVLLEVNCSEESQKHGVAVGAVACLGEQISTLSHVRLVGLMTMAARTDDPETARPTFLRLREIFDEMRRDRVGGKDFVHLSMGMSQDYQVAVEEGATLVRIGTALFS